MTFYMAVVRKTSFMAQKCRHQAAVQKDVRSFSAASGAEAGGALAKAGILLMYGSGTNALIEGGRVQRRYPESLASK